MEVRLGGGTSKFIEGEPVSGDHLRIVSPMNRRRAAAKDRALEQTADWRSGPIRTPAHNGVEAVSRTVL